jgi:hypothetical protein
MKIQTCILDHLSEAQKFIGRKTTVLKNRAIDHIKFAKHLVTLYKDMQTEVPDLELEVLWSSFVSPDVIKYRVTKSSGLIVNCKYRPSAYVGSYYCTEKCPYCKEHIKEENIVKCNYPTKCTKIATFDSTHQKSTNSKCTKMEEISIEEFYTQKECRIKLECALELKPGEQVVLYDKICTNESKPFRVPCTVVKVEKQFPLLFNGSASKTPIAYVELQYKSQKSSHKNTWELKIEHNGLYVTYGYPPSKSFITKTTL